jgi:hypothetical protein
MSIQEAFFSICKDAQPAESIYVSLYVSVPYYGGPEEGGWWGSDTHLVAYKEFRTQEEADAAEEQIKAYAEKLNQEAKKAHGELCLAQMEWCDARGIDDYNSVFGEVDGEDSYYVVQEERPGEGESRGCRHYE